MNTLQKKAPWPCKLSYCLRCASPLNGFGQYCSDKCRREDQHGKLCRVLEGVQAEPILAEVLQSRLLQESPRERDARSKRDQEAEEARTDREARLVIMLGVRQ